MTELPATEVELSLPPAREAAEPVTMIPVRLTSIDQLTGNITQPSGNMVVGALKKTGSSIVTVGVKTGATIVSALRAAGSAFRKVL
jgi:hypothetical protein